MRVEEVAAEATHDLRRRVLRAGVPDPNVVFPEDTRPGTFHLAVRDDADRIVGIGTFLPDQCPHRSGRRGWRLRGMAVEPALQGQGIGRALLAEGLARLKADGAEVVWARGRDTALGFYEREGWVVVGDAYVPDETGLLHHDVVLDL
jgi:GNAT superfamily N-acetyltransferase